VSEVHVCRTCRLLAVERDELAEKVRQLEVKLRGAWEAPAEFSLSPAEEACLRALVNRQGTVTKAALHEATRDPFDPQTDEVLIKIVDVYICRLRQKLKPFGLSIQTSWGTGYRLTPDTRARLLNWNTDSKRDAA
jgi:two-component system cell cycle response regulator CtrA